MTNEDFETTRLISIIAVVALRIVLIRQYLQAYLNIAPQKVISLKKESGNITNVDLQKMVVQYVP